jgi:sugar phosphate isomerase/epimerase
MIKSAITVSLVEESRGGPFVFWDGIPAACARSAELGYDAIEIFAPSADSVDRDKLTGLLEQHNLKVAAVGTEAGMVKHGLSLTDPKPEKRDSAKDFIRQMIDFGGLFGAPAIIGSMQGKWGGDIDLDGALAMLRDALNELGPYAANHGVPLIYEPLNRYETNLIKTVADGVAFLKTLSTDNVKLLADLFHMNIEEADLTVALRAGEGYIGHVHFVDSNRQATGLGHMNFGPIAAALIETNYDGYASAEAFPIPNSDTAAVKTIEAFNKYFRK